MNTDSRTQDPRGAPLSEPRPAGPSAPPWPRLVRLAALLAAIGACTWWLLLLLERVEMPGFGLVDTTRARMDAGPGWVDPRWQDELRLALAEMRQVSAEDAGEVAQLVARIRALPFVESVGEPRVLWPDGIELAVRLREPVACLSVGRQFLPLCADGILLSGRWPSPPTRGTGFLPVVVPGDQTLGARAWPGARLVDGPLEDGLAIAATMWRYLEPGDLTRLGRIVIDARKSRQTSDKEKGSLFLLEGTRTVAFGRSPNVGEPGELPVELKWQVLSRGLALLDPQEAARRGLQPLDWEFLDARWDRGALIPRGESPVPGGK